jgi:hypothetical protein
MMSSKYCFTFNGIDHAALEKPCDPSLYISPKMEHTIHIRIDEFGFEQEIAKHIL